MQNEEKIKECVQKFTFYTENLWSRSREATLKWCNDQYNQEHQKGGFVDNMITEIGDIADKKTLEVGSGTGGLTVGVALKGAIAYGIEPNKYGIYASALRQGRYKDINAHFVVGVAEYLCFKEGTFDVIFSNQVLEHVDNLDKTLSEIHRVLKRNGRIYVKIPNNLWPFEGHYQIFWPPLLPRVIGKYYAKLRGKNPSGITTIRYIIPFSIEYKLKKIGFNNIKNHSAENHLEKFSRPEKLVRQSPSKILKVLKFLKLNLLVGKLVIRLGFYPGIELSATKKG